MGEFSARLDGGAADPQVSTVLFAELVSVSRDVAGVSSRNAKVAHLAAALRKVPPEEAEASICFLLGELRQGKIGLGFAQLSALGGVLAAPEPQLSVAEVDRAFSELASATGKGKSSAREQQLGALFARATAEEQDFLRRLVVGELRQGALEGVVLDALAKATGTPKAAVQRALLFSGSLSRVGSGLLVNGSAALADYTVELFRPLSPMLADTAGGLAEALERVSPAALEYKLDGARIQVHKSGEDVRVFSRGGHDVTRAVPELAELVKGLPARSLVLDGEAIALGPGGRPLPFQTTMRRFGRKQYDAALAAELPLSAFFFDCLYLDSQVLVDASNAERVRALAERVPEALRVRRSVVHDTLEGEAFLKQALAAGHEGLVAKDLASTYEAGRRAAQWLKLKPVHTLDLVVLAVERGSGRRSAYLSNIHLGARDPESGGFAMLGKTFKGMTDAMLAWQTARFEELAVRREGHVVWVAPVQVVEVAFDGVQTSSQYACGVALRFARVVRYRLDKGPEQADTLATVRALCKVG